MPDDQSAKRRKKVTLFLTQDDYIRLKADQVRKSDGKPSTVSFSDMAHEQWLRKLPPAPKNFRMNKKKTRLKITKKPRPNVAAADNPTAV